MTMSHFTFEMSPEYRNKSGAITPDGTIVFNRLSQGAKNSPAMFVLMLRYIFNHMLFKSLYVYMDDVVCFSSSFEDHLTHLRQLFMRLRLVNLTLKVSKCSFAKAEVTMLGFIVGRHGIKPQPDKLTAVSRLPIPRNQREVRACLGLFGFYRRFVQNFSLIAAPMSALLKKDAPFEWTKDCQVAFESLRDSLLAAQS
jgi:hypothetical protein